MCERGSPPVSTARRLREATVAAGIVIGGLMMLGGSLYGILLQPGGPEELGTLWPFYLGGLVAVLLGWMNGDWQR